MGVALERPDRFKPQSLVEIEVSGELWVMSYSYCSTVAFVLYCRVLCMFMVPWDIHN